MIFPQVKYRVGLYGSYAINGGDTSFDRIWYFDDAKVVLLTQQANIKSSLRLLQ